jgi:hypothetical protein
MAVSRNSNAASRSKPSTPVQKLSPAAAARVRARLNANARMRKTLMTPGEVKSGVVIPAGGAAVQRFLQATGRTAQEAKAGAGKTAVKKAIAEVRADRAKDTERTYNYNPREVSPQLKASEARSELYGQRRTPRLQGVSDRDNIAATNRMVPRKPNWRENRGARRARVERRNSPTRPGYSAPASVARPAAPKGGRPGTSMRPVPKPAAKKKVAPAAAPDRRIESMRFQGTMDRKGNSVASTYKYGSSKPENTAVDDALNLAEMQATVAAGKPKPVMKTDPGKGARGSISEAQLQRTLARELALLDEVRKARRRDADRANGRYGRTPEESIAARKKYREEHPKEPYVTPMRPSEIEKNRTALVDERIKPVPPKPKPSDSPEKAAKINAEIRRVEAQNDRAREASAAKRAAVDQPRPSTPGYVPMRSLLKSPKQQAEAARLKRDPDAFKKLEADAKAAKDARDAKAVADRAAARASNPANIARQKEKAAADKAAAEARAERAARDTEILNKNRPKKKIVRKKR